MVDQARAYPTFFWEFEKLAQAPVLVTCVVQEISREPLLTGFAHRTVTAHTVLRVLRSFPQSTFTAGERIRLDYVALPIGDSGMNGPDVPKLQPGDIFAIPLKLNPEPASAPWHLIAEEGRSLTVPAIVKAPPFIGAPHDGRTFLLREIASTLIGGTRKELFAEAFYASTQRSLVPDLMSILEPKLGRADPRWPQIAVSLLSSMGVPRPTVASLRAGKDGTAGSLITAVLQKLGPSKKAEDALILGLLANSDIASWGVGMTLPEFAHEPTVLHELRRMLQARHPGVLSVARNILISGQKEILGDAVALSLYYLHTPGTNHSELQAACWVVRDFGTDEQFARVDLLKDERIYQSDLRYSDVARGELTRIQQMKK